MNNNNNIQYTYRNKQTNIPMISENYYTKCYNIPLIFNHYYCGIRK